MVQEMIPNSMMIGCLAGHVDAGITAHVLKLLALLTMMTVFCVPTVSELFTLCTICSTIVHRRSLTETFGGRAIGLGLVTTCFIGVQRQSPGRGSWCQSFCSWSNSMLASEFCSVTCIHCSLFMQRCNMPK